MRAVLVALLLPIATQALFFGNSCGCGCQPPPACPAAPVCPPAPVCGGGVPAVSYAAGPTLFAPQQQPIYQQLAVQGYAQPQAAQQVVVQQTEAPLAAQTNNQEFASGGATETTFEQQPTQETAPATVAEPEQTQAAENTVYDDIANTQQVATATEEYHAVASSRRRHFNLRRAPAAFDPKCNSETLKNIIHQNIGDSTSSSKRAIQKTASEEIGGHVDVICSTSTFSYIVNTELYCETEKDGITCFAFRQSN